jgi:hypothetical protein
MRRSGARGREPRRWAAERAAMRSRCTQARSGERVAPLGEAEAGGGIEDQAATVAPGPGSEIDTRTPLWKSSWSILLF